MSHTGSGVSWGAGWVNSKSAASPVMARLSALPHYVVLGVGCGCFSRLEAATSGYKRLQAASYSLEADRSGFGQ